MEEAIGLAALLFGVIFHMIYFLFWMRAWLVGRIYRFHSKINEAEILGWRFWAARV